MSVLWLGDEDNDGKYSIKVTCFRWASPKLVSSPAVSANSDPSYGITADLVKTRMSRFVKEIGSSE